MQSMPLNIAQEFYHSIQSANALRVEELTSPLLCHYIETAERTFSMPNTEYVARIRDGRVGGYPMQMTTTQMQIVDCWASVHVHAVGKANAFSDVLTIKKHDDGKWLIVSRAVRITPTSTD